MVVWSHAAMVQLLQAVDGARAEGLDPAGYGRDTLAYVVASGDVGPASQAVAWMSARRLASDYARGRITRRERFGWHIDQPATAPARMDADLDQAVRTLRVGEYLHGLLPTDPRYLALRAALASTPPEDALRATRIRASMERWRWMPRTLGADYVLVNVPAYRLTLFEGGQPVVTHDVVVGAPKTPTPMLSADIGSIIVNPWWTLPPTVLKEGHGRAYPASRGYVYQTIGGRTYVRQRPGPNNALGRMKIDMPNPYAIYLHDTPAKWGFARPERALSHGCIRVKDITALAARIGDAEAIGKALDGTVMHSFKMPRRMPVYIAYFTAAPDSEGQVVLYGDPYDRDAMLVDALASSIKAPRVVLT
jgi:murein L,D-transpeptidase YcbB/YkuD